ncbi:class I SAM-dependent DNA methyltransferase [Clostridium sp. ZS1]|uniref:type I restriction-modification system subunit M n=1 Tax=Clostridium sp. ZS1 TaxID=2949989 RepID=UPI002079CE2D|nr:class I SAM-dependent DNA methyltransferase [Clostridium sp. ZS1]
MNNIMNQTTINIKEKANLIWSIADLIRDLYKPHEYGKVILPLTVIKRFNDTLLPTRDAVIKVNQRCIDRGIEVKNGFLETAAGYKFYNISPFTFQTLVADSENIESNFNIFLAGFSENVQDVLENFEFDKEITKMANNGVLFAVLQEFNTKKGYMGPEVITSTDMGYIFEELIRRFSESYNEQAGAHFTSRDIIYLMTDLLICEDKTSLIEEGVVKTVYDMTMGTSQMLGCMTERLTELDSEANVKCFGQEINPETYAIAKSDMLIKGGESNNMKKGNTLSDDKFSDYTFDYIISNPPFGVEWKIEKDAVTKENNLGYNGRFGAGLPKISDGQMLFTLNGIKKLKENGKMAIIHNGSPLFSGDAGSGPSEIRRYIIESDYLEAIVQMPTDLFYNTGISTYIWIVTKNKPINRQGKIQLIDASQMFEKRRKSIGNKRNDITEELREVIVKAFGECTDKEYECDGKVLSSKVFNNEDFGYNKITIERPKLDQDGEILKKNKKPVSDPSKRDTENVPLTEDIKEYFEREVIPFAKDAWIDEKKTKIGYEIPFTRYFYKYIAPPKADDIMKEILQKEAELNGSLKELFENE